MAGKLVSLDKIDPADAWKPWQPTAADPWSRKWSAHLYRRAAFGGGTDDLLEADRLGLPATLELLLAGRANESGLWDSLLDVGRVAVEHDNGGEKLRGWWLYCMLHTGFPLREKMTLFWHNHFATSIVKVQSPIMMFRQNLLLREHALGKFGPFLQAMSKDAAMLVWLDSNSNLKGKPNENYARELLELFSLGVGNYTENDIREAARAFTGWQTSNSGFRFNESAHDGDPKTFFGQTGNWDGGDVVRIVLEQPAAARFLVRKLYHYFVNENEVPPDALLAPLCDSFRNSGYDIAALLRTMLSSKHFFSGYAFRQRIKSPVEYVLGAVAAVYKRFAEDDDDYRPLPQQVLVQRLNAMGQHLFSPPNVKGWPGGRSWLNTSTLLERTNFASDLAMGNFSGVPDAGAPPKALDPARLPKEAKANTSAEIVQVLIDTFLPGGIRPETRAKFVAFVGEGKPVGQALDRRVREGVHAMMTMAEYQLA